MRSTAFVLSCIKKVREELDMPVAIMQDTKGPEFRIKTFKDGKITLQEGDMFTFTAKDVQGTKDRVSVNFYGACHVRWKWATASSSTTD